MALKDMIELFSDYTVGDTGAEDITTTQLSLLESATLTQAQALNCGRFTDDDFLRLHSYVILDKWVRKAGKGRIQEETVKENTWKAVPSQSSSSFMDDAYQMITMFDNGNYTCAGVGEAAIRADSNMNRLSDDWYITEEKTSFK